jgi:methyl-accepting chemotaxis protein
MKIGKKLMLMIISLNLAGTGVLVGTVLRFSQKEITNLINNEIINLAGKKAEEIEKWFDTYMDTARTTAQFFEQYQRIPIVQRREFFDMMVRTVVEANIEIAAVATCWEPNALDGLDSRYVNTPGTDESGRFIPYWSRGNTGSVLEPLVNYEVPGPGDYYLIPKKTGSETMIEPYWYLINGQNRLITTLAVPIKKAGRFVGAVSVDIDISVIQEQVQRIRPYEGSIAAVFSNGGVVSGHYNPERIGKHMTETEKDTIGSHLPNLMNAIRTGQEYTFTNVVPTIGKFQFFCFPFTVGSTTTPWSLMIGIPSRSINAPVYHMLIISAIIGGIMILFIMAVAFVMTRSISNPLNYMVTVLKDIGDGDLTQQLKIKSKDEIGTMTNSFNNMVEKIRTLILVIQDKVASLSHIGTVLSTNMTETAAAINEISSNISNMKTQAGKQSAGVDEAGTAIALIINNINELNMVIDKQADSVSQSSSAIEEMLANIQSVTQTLINNAGNVNNLADVSEIGRSGLQEVASAIQEISKESEGLLEINGVMENIASQTNLLSMNAAIEAAHAGEAGKGFAVVADEIRKLAESSGEQSKTISAVLKKIKDSIDNITKSTDAVLNKFEAIDSGIKVVSAQEENIRSAMEEQGVGSKQILEAISRLNEITGQVKDSSKEMHFSSGEVLKTSKTLEAITQELTNGMNEIAIGAEQVNFAVNHVNDISEQNKKDLVELIEEVNKFKI